MRPVVVTLVLLLVVMFIKESAADFFCDPSPDEACGSGWIRLDSNRCLMVSLNPKSFDEAQSFCESEGGQLLIVKDDSTKAALACLHYYQYIGTYKFWVGARRQDGSQPFQWIDHSGDVEYFYDRGEKTNCMTTLAIPIFAGPLGLQECRSQPCDSPQYFLCEKPV